MTFKQILDGEYDIPIFSVGGMFGCEGNSDSPVVIFIDGGTATTIDRLIIDGGTATSVDTKIYNCGY